MYNVTVEMEFNAGHYLRLPGGRQEQPHSHKWRAQATVEADKLDEYGLVMDFHHLLGLLQEIVAPLTQQEYINDLAEFDEVNPTTERLAEYVYRRLKDNLPGTVRLAEVVVWETAYCWAGRRG